MDDKAIIFGFNLLLWFYLAYRFSVAVAKRKITNGASLHVWGVIFGCYLIAALTADPIKLALDGQFGGLPASTLVEVRRLANPDFLIEIEVIAIVAR